MHITILPAVRPDIPSLASIQASAYTADAVTLTQHPEGEISERERLTRVFAQDYDSREPWWWLKAVDSSTDTIVGFALWRLYDGSDGFPPSGKTPTSLGAAIGLEMQAARARWIAGRRCLYLATLAVEPAWQGRGVGSRLLEVGRERADVLAVESWLEATPAGVRVYERAGWREVERLRFNLGEWRKGGKEVEGKGEWYEYRCMLREPVRVVARGVEGKREDERV